jgi:hypothetical protein
MSKYEDYLMRSPRRLRFAAKQDEEIHPLKGIVIVCLGVLVVSPIIGTAIVLLFSVMA